MTNYWTELRKAQRQAGHDILVKAVRGWRHLTPEQRAEAERLAALQPGAEDCALRRFAMEHYRRAGAA